MILKLFLPMFLCLLFVETGSAKNKFFVDKRMSIHRTPSEISTQSKKLLYYGGPVISNVKVFVGLWNNQVDTDVKNNITDFYAAYVNSPHMDWLNEYQTGINSVDGRPGTNQQIGRGSVAGEHTLTPSVTGRTLTDIQIQQEIEKQIDQGHFVQPDANTLYMLHFPADIKITIEGMSSCISFGGYHNNFKSAKYGDIFYGVMPDCGGFSSNSLRSATYVASHELIEAITDPMPTAGSSPAFPQAWNSADGYEIADLCGGTATLNGPKANYAISQEWSNTRNRCYDGQ